MKNNNKTNKAKQLSKANTNSLQIHLYKMDQQKRIQEIQERNKKRLEEKKQRQEKKQEREEAKKKWLEEYWLDEKRWMPKIDIKCENKKKMIIILTNISFKFNEKFNYKILGKNADGFSHYSFETEDPSIMIKFRKQIEILLRKTIEHTKMRRDSFLKTLK